MILMTFRYYSMRLHAFLCLSVFALLSLPALADTDENAELYANMNTRLSYMQQVALYKWQHQLPIEDLAREKIVLAQSVTAAESLGITSAAITDFFQVQIELAKKIQRQYHQQWREHGLLQTLQTKQNTKLSLDKIRPALTTLGQTIIQQIAEHQDQHDFSVFNLAIDTPLVSIEDKAVLFRSLSLIKPKVYLSTLDKIIAEKILYVGTTGDYEPFSYFEAGQIKGIDIDLANRLADSLGAQAVFLPTSWSNLITDLSSERFDIMMSGISKQLFRQRVGLQSDIYLEDGKTPISLCAKKERYDSLAKIDKPDIRMIVNKGGTNQRFVDANIKQAKITVHSSNVTIFQELIANRADVMITDRVEVQLQTKKHPELCSTMPNNLNYSAKAFLMGRDPIWKEYVDAWLELSIKDGSVSNIFNQYI